MFNRGALVGLALAVAEVVTFVLARQAVGLANVILISAVLLVVGLVVVRRQLPAALASAVAVEAPAVKAPAPDRALAALGGLLLVLPGFVTGLVGALLLVPPVRAMLRDPVSRRFAQLVPRAFGTPFPVNGFPSHRRGSSGRDVIDVDVVSEDMTQPARNELP